MKIIGRIALLIAIFFAMDWFYSATELDHFLEEEAGQFLQVEKIVSCDVIYVSESSNFSPDNSNDSDRRKLSQMVAAYFPALQFEAINKPAAHAGVYRKLLNIMPPEAEVKTIIIAINLRSFGASWINSELETPLNKANVMYNQRPPLLNRFLVSLNAYDDASVEERTKQMLSDWGKESLPYPFPRNTVNNWCAEEKWGDWRDPKRQLADQFIKQYAFVIDEKNPRIQDLDAIAELAKSREWNLVYSILAENVAWADSLVGDDLTDLMYDNASWIQERYSNRGVLVLNNLDALPSEYFTDKNFPTEHYDQNGRQLMAVRIARFLETNNVGNMNH